MIFNNFRTEDLSRKRARETFFEFLDRSTLETCNQKRALISSLLADYPQIDQLDIIGRLKSREEANFVSALFEMVLFNVLLRLGMKVDVHPCLSNGYKPDFEVLSPNGHKFYIEAVLSSERSQRSVAGQRMIDTTLEVVNSHAHPLFRVAVTSTGEPSTQPNAKKLKENIHRWLDGLGPNTKSDDEKAISKFDINGWQLQCKAIPINSRKENSSGILFISIGSDAHMVNRSTPIRDAIVSKANKYGKLDSPLMIAVNSLCFFLDEDEELSALYGSLQADFSLDNLDADFGISRTRNGAWNGSKGPQYRNVCAVWIFRNLHLYSLCDAQNTLYLNPFSCHDIPESLLTLSHHRVEGDVGRKYDGLPIHSLLGLDD